MSVTITCHTCKTTAEVESPPEGKKWIGRCPQCDGLMFEAAPQTSMFEKNVTHTREDF